MPAAASSRLMQPLQAPTPRLTPTSTRWHEAAPGLAVWLFATLRRNASEPAGFLRLPPGSVVELGARVVV